MPADPMPLLEPAEVAALLYVDLPTVSRWAEGGKLTSVDAADGHRRFAQDEVLDLMVDLKRSRRRSAGRGLVAPDPRRDWSSVSDEGGDAALEVSLTLAEVKAAQALASDAADRARRARVVAGRLAASLVAEDAAQAVVATRFRSDAAAVRVRKAARSAASAEWAVAEDGDASVAERVARTADAAAEASAALASETVELAASVARSVARTAQLVAATLQALDEAIEAEVLATATAIALRAVAAAHMSEADLANRALRPSD